MDFLSTVVQSSLDDWKRAVRENKPFSERTMYLERYSAALANMTKQHMLYAEATIRMCAVEKK